MIMTLRPNDFGIIVFTMPPEYNLSTPRPLIIDDSGHFRSMWDQDYAPRGPQRTGYYGLPTFRRETAQINLKLLYLVILETEQAGVVYDGGIYKAARLDPKNGTYQRLPIGWFREHLSRTEIDANGNLVEQLYEIIPSQENLVRGADLHGVHRLTVGKPRYTKVQYLW